MQERIIFMGTPEFAVPILVSLIRSPYHVVAVYTQPDKPVGRNRQVAWSPVKKLATEYKIPVIQLNTLKSREAVDELANFEPDVIIVAAFGYILPPEVLSLPKFGCLNVHPSLLPRHRGSSPVAASLLYGDRFTGVTIMLMDAGMDSGPILAQQKVDISSKDTSGTLTLKLARVGTEFLIDMLPHWLAGKLKPQPQDESQATYSKLMRKKDAEIDWHLSAVELCQKVRAYNPWPGCYTWWKGKQLKVHEATPLEDVAKGELGKVVTLSPLTPVGVITGEGVIGLCQVQLEGKRKMGVDDFIRGQRDFIGSILG